MNEHSVVDTISDEQFTTWAESTDRARALYLLEGIAGTLRLDTKTEACFVSDVFKTTYEYGFGVKTTGQWFVNGFTGTAKPTTFQTMLDRANITYISPMYRAQYHDRLQNSVPLNLALATGDDVHRVFETFRPGSCMRYEECRPLRTLYVNNPKVVGVIYTPEKQPIIDGVMSALVWIGKQRVYLDRIYSGAGATAYMARQCIEYLQGLFGKPCVSIYNEFTSVPKHRRAVRFKLSWDGNPLPYMDSIRNVHEYTETSVTLTTTNKRVSCCSTSGTMPDGSAGCRCVECNAIMGREAYIDNMHYCENCFRYCCLTNSYVSPAYTRNIYLWNESEYCYDSVYISRNALNASEDIVCVNQTCHRYVRRQDVKYDNRGNVVDFQSSMLCKVVSGQWCHVNDVCSTPLGLYLRDECIRIDSVSWPLSYCLSNE